MYRPEAQCPLVHILHKIKYLCNIIVTDTNIVSLILHKSQLGVANNALKKQSKAIICIEILIDKDKYDLIH